MWMTSVDAVEHQLRPILARLGYRAFDFEILPDGQPRALVVAQPPLKFIVRRKSNRKSATYDERTCATDFERDLRSGRFGAP